MKYKCIKNEFLGRFNVGEIYTIQCDMVGYLIKELMINISDDTLKTCFIKVDD